MPLGDNQRKWYREYYGKMGQSRNDLLKNKGVLFQTLASEMAFIKAARNIPADFSSRNVLDVGCGGGADLYQLIRIGCRVDKITGIDIQEERISEARRIYPTANFVVADAAEMTFVDSTFDVVFESTMFATLPDDNLSGKIAREMIRVCKPGGFLILVDWKVPKFNDTSYKALTRARLHKLFNLGNQVVLRGVYHGALIPPVGRFLSSYCQPLYFLVSTVFPFLVGQVAYLLQKTEN